MKPRSCRRLSIKNLDVVVDAVVFFHCIDHPSQGLKHLSKQTFTSSVDVVCFRLSNHGGIASLLDESLHLHFITRQAVESGALGMTESGVKPPHSKMLR